MADVSWVRGLGLQEHVVREVSAAWRNFMRGPLGQTLLRLEAAAAEAALEAQLAPGMAKLRASSLLIGAADLALTAGVPLAVWVGVFVAMGAPYVEAKALVKKESFQSGFSQGFVMGLLKWEWDHARSRFGKFEKGHTNVMDQSLSYEAANAYNAGLLAGFSHGSLLNDDAKKAILKRIKSLSRGASPGNWSRADQVSYVVELAAAARLNNIFMAD